MWDAMPDVRLQYDVLLVGGSVGVGTLVLIALWLNRRWSLDLAILWHWYLAATFLFAPSFLIIREGVPVGLVFTGLLIGLGALMTAFLGYWIKSDRKNSNKRPNDVPP
jgi:hypothetical protein